MRRRVFVAGLVGVAGGLVAAPLGALAQPRRTWRVGFLSGGARPPDGKLPPALREALREPDDFDAAFTAMAQNRPDALFLVTDALTLLNRKRVIEFASQHRIAAMYEFNQLVRDGRLMSYGASQDDNYRKAATYVDRILKGAAPSTLPVERPGRYYLTVNLKTAKALGLTMPPSLLLRADEVIE